METFQVDCLPDLTIVGREDASQHEYYGLLPDMVCYVWGEFGRDVEFIPGWIA